MASSYIYVLREIGDNEVRYVGQSQSPRHRFYSYANGSDIENLKDGNPRRAWLSKILTDGGGFEMEVIEECSLSVITRRETYWLAHYKALGHRVTNTCSPGNSASMQMNSFKRKGDFGPEWFTATSILYQHKNAKLKSRKIATSLQKAVDIGRGATKRQAIDEIRQEVKELRSDVDAIKALLSLICVKVGVDA